MSGLTTQQLEFFHTEGYLHVPDALRAEDLDPVQAELEEIIDRAARRLVAEGKSNQDIAEQLFISPHTVVRHVSNILAKTSSANRAEAASYATRQGLGRS